MSAHLSDYDYDLPRELIAQRPPEHRDDSRMMVLHRDTQAIEHRQFRELKTFLQQGDLLVLNDTQVLPARRFSNDGAIEFLFLERLGPGRWKCLVNPGRKMRVGASAMIEGVALYVEEITSDGERIVVLNEDVDLYTGGSMPLPSYVRRESDTEDTTRYQTVFAHTPGALAAPTAGLHFTSEILSEIPHTFDVACRDWNVFARALREHCRSSHACRAVFYFAFCCRQNQRGRANGGRGYDRGAGVGSGRPRKWKTEGSGRCHKHFHLSAIPISRR